MAAAPAQTQKPARKWQAAAAAEPTDEDRARGLIAAVRKVINRAERDPVGFPLVQRLQGVIAVAAEKGGHAVGTESRKERKKRLRATTQEGEAQQQQKQQQPQPQQQQTQGAAQSRPEHPAEQRAKPRQQQGATGEKSRPTKEGSKEAHSRAGRMPRETSSRRAQRSRCGLKW